jgi:hypothetical protein
MNKDQILAALPSLNQDDLRAIAAVIVSMLRRDGTVGPLVKQGNSPNTWLAEALQATLGQPNYPLRGTALKAFNKNAPIALAFMNTHFAAPMTRYDRALALMRYLLGLLADNLKVMKVPVTTTTLAQNLHRIPEVFNDAFPGYALSNATAMIAMTLLDK